MDYHLQLTVDPKQARIILRGLELVSRLGMGQFDFVCEELHNHFLNSFDELAQVLKETKSQLGLHRDAHFGIGNDRTSEDAKIAFMLQKVIQKSIAVQENHSMYSIWHDGNVVQYSNHPEAKCIIVNKISR